MKTWQLYVSVWFIVFYISESIQEKKKGIHNGIRNAHNRQRTRASLAAQTIVFVGMNFRVGTYAHKIYACHKIERSRPHTQQEGVSFFCQFFLFVSITTIGNLKEERNKKKKKNHGIRSTSASQIGTTFVPPST